MPRKPLFKRRMEEWIEDCSDRMMSTKTLELYEAVATRSFRYAKENGWPMDPNRIRPRQVREYYESLQGLSTSTQLTYLTVLLCFLKWCGNGNLDGVNFRIKPSRTRVDWLDEEQVAMLVANAPYPALRAMIVLFAYTGMRLGELMSLRTKDMSDSEIRVRGKGRKSRVIPVDSAFWSELIPYLAERGRIGDHETFLVHGRNGEVRPYTDSGIYEALIKHGRQFGLHSSPHTFRRSFGRHLYKRGCPLAELKTLMGHASVEQTIQYLGIGDCDIQEAISQYRPDYRKIAENTRKVYLLSSSQTSKKG